MIYKPSKGKMKDGCMIFEGDTFYLFSMYHKDGSSRFNNVWLARSDDGVHFEDYGCVVEDFPDCIWAMKIYRGKDAFYMNSGSFTADQKQAVLKFWRSEDLLHWTYKPELDVVAPNQNETNARLDCMNVLNYNGKYYGYATGQFGYLESEDGIRWVAYPSRINYSPFPPYNTALGGFEIADFIEMDERFYLLCGGFGHLGMDGYGVYLYESTSPDGIFTPCLPFYRLNGTSHRWVNMWERCFTRGSETLCHNYMYDGYTYEKGNVYLPPIKKMKKNEQSLCLAWWDGNNVLYGDPYQKAELLTVENASSCVFANTDVGLAFSELLPIADGAIIECELTLEKNKFTEYSSGGIYLAEEGNSGSAILFDTNGKCSIHHVKDFEICAVEDVIGFGSTAPYYVESGKTYNIRILSRNGMFEIYVNDLYLQTFNNAHTSGQLSSPIIGFGAVSQRRRTMLSNITVYQLKL